MADAITMLNFTAMPIISALHQQNGFTFIYKVWFMCVNFSWHIGLFYSVFSTVLMCIHNCWIILKNDWWDICGHVCHCFEIFYWRGLKCVLLGVFGELKRNKKYILAWKLVDQSNHGSTKHTIGRQVNGSF